MTSSPGFIAKNKNAMPALLRLAGSVIALFGVLFIIAGMSEPSLQNLIPVGMFVTFGGLVLALHNRQKVERIRRAKKTENTKNPN